MEQVTYCSGEKQEAELIRHNLVAFNCDRLGCSKTDMFDEMTECAKGADGTMFGGICGDVELNSVLHVKAFWVCEDYRRSGMGTELLHNLQERAIAKGATFSYLETFDFQAKVFFLKNGYDVFAKVDYKNGHVIYFMRSWLRAPRRAAE